MLPYFLTANNHITSNSLTICDHEKNFVYSYMSCNITKTWSNTQKSPSLYSLLSSCEATVKSSSIVLYYVGYLFSNKDSNVILTSSGSRSYVRRSIIEFNAELGLLCYLTFSSGLKLIVKQTFLDILSKMGLYWLLSRFTEFMSLGLMKICGYFDIYWGIWCFYSKSYEWNLGKCFVRIFLKL